MRKFLQITAVGGAALLLISFVLAPILVYELGIPWLPSVPRASDSQLGLFYAIDTPVIAGAVWLLGVAYKYLLHGQNSSPGLAMPKPQSIHSSHSQGGQTTYDDPIVIGGGRQKDHEAWILIYFGFICVGGGGGWLSLIPAVKSDGSFKVAVICGLAIAIFGIISLNYGKRRECLKIGSEGIDYSEAKDHLFIPWDEISSVYVDNSMFSDYLYVKLKNNSKLHFLEPIKSRYKKGAIVICGVSNLSSSVIPKHLVENALDIYRP